MMLWYFLVGLVLVLMEPAAVWGLGPTAPFLGRNFTAGSSELTVVCCLVQDYVLGTFANGLLFRPTGIEWIWAWNGCHLVCTIGILRGNGWCFRILWQGLQSNSTEAISHGWPLYGCGDTSSNTVVDQQISGGIMVGVVDFWWGDFRTRDRIQSKCPIK